jgi:hypothetical protein
MNNARQILMQIIEIIGSSRGKEDAVDEFLTFVQVKVMTELIGALPKDKQNQVIDQFMTLPPRKKESVFYPYYTVEYMQGRVQTATKAAILQQIVEPQWDQLSPSQQESIRSLLEEIER